MLGPLPSPRDLYPWASSELLDECSCLLATRATREHKGDSCSYDHRGFARRHDDNIAVLPCTLGEPVCGDGRANEGVPFFYFYQVVFKTTKVRLPFSWFEKELLTKINVAPAQLYPNSWAFVKAFDILFGFLGCAPSVDLFLHFFEVKRQRHNLWVTLSNVPRRVLFTPFQSSFSGCDPAGNSNVEESLRSTLCPFYATASSAESPSEPSLASPNVTCKTHRRRL